MTGAAGAYIQSLQVEPVPGVAVSQTIANEQAVAIYDILDHNAFAVAAAGAGPYDLTLSRTGDTIVFAVTCDEKRVDLSVALGPFRKIIKDYFFICDTYYKALGDKSSAQIEAVDMGRRATHNEGADMLQQRLKDRVTMNHETARKLFTLVCVLSFGNGISGA